MTALSRAGTRTSAQAVRAGTPEVATGVHRASISNQAWLRRLAHDGSVQVSDQVHASGGPELLIGAQDDPLEHEADQIADQVMRAAPAAPPETTMRAMRLSRKCSACEDEEKPRLRAKASASETTGAGEPAPVGVHAVLSAPGRSLDPSTRDFFEPRFGSDFGEVRLHADGQAGASARAVGAVAYAVGNHVVVDPDHCRPDSEAGRRLLAHELAHTLQQSGDRSLAKVRRDVLDGGGGPAAP
ncbi:MAG: DUF4157 domain-containing protein [Burkholderiales bacterium]|nr:DUF4157 domain-containing protein [Burkholderiales bacterium]